jgi:hypothetical protein
MAARTLRIGKQRSNVNPHTPNPVWELNCINFSFNMHTSPSCILQLHPHKPEEPPINNLQASSPVTASAAKSSPRGAASSKRCPPPLASNSPSPTTKPAGKPSRSKASRSLTRPSTHSKQNATARSSAPYRRPPSLQRDTPPPSSRCVNA